MTPALAVILALVGFVTLGVNVGAIAVMSSQRAEMLDHSDRDIQNLSVLLAKQTDRSLQAIDAVQHNIVEHLALFGLNDPDALRLQGDNRFVHDMLVRDVAPLHFVDWMSLIDARGTRVSSSFKFPSEKLDLSSRDYFKALSVEGAPDTFISKASINPQTRKQTIFLARRLSDFQGRFVGVLSAAIAVDTFQQLYRGIDLDATGNIILAREDGVILSEQGSVRGEQSATAIVPASEDDSRVRTATAKLDEYPVVVMTRYNIGAVLANWYNRALFVAAMVILVDLSVLVAGILALRHLRQNLRMGEAERHSARHDILTGLPNRACFQETLDEALADTSDSSFGLVLIDLDNFKEVNDNQGHQAGDELLKLVSARLTGCLGPADRLTRLGGDEFAIIQRGIKGRNEVEELAAAALATFETPFPIRDRQISVGASFGIALGTCNDSSDILFDQADMALYQAKALGRGTIRFFSAELQSAKVERRTLAQDLKEAVREETLNLYFQPIIDLRGCNLIGFEALLRWHDPVRGQVPPSTFIPIAEETGAIGALGRWVMREACRRAASWPGSLVVAVNLSAVQMQLSDVAAEVEEVLAETGLPASRLEIEITESVLLDHPSAEKTLHRLVALGVSISLDDFGTGYSSLSYLCSFPFGRIKIDRSFVARMVENKEAAAIVETVRDLGARLGMGITAEGIETHAQLRRLQEIGCDAGQGYLISRPMPAWEVPRFTEAFSLSAPVADRVIDLSEMAEMPAARVA